jgi:WD40 repeat protein
VATGELGPIPDIFIWDAFTMEQVIKVKSKLRKGIQRLSFSPSGDVLVAVALDIDHTVAVFDTKTGKQLSM